MRSYTRFASSWVLLLTFTSLCKAEPRRPHTSGLETYPWDLAGPVEELRKEFREHWARNINTPPIVRPRGLR